MQTKTEKLLSQIFTVLVVIAICAIAVTVKYYFTDEISFSVPRLR